jgi:hypothetical protein
MLNLLKARWRDYQVTRVRAKLIAAVAAAKNGDVKMRYRAEAYAARLAQLHHS